MKSPKWLLGIAAAMAVTLCGCNQDEAVTTDDFQKAFASAPAELKSHADKVVEGVKQAKYKDALSALDNLLDTNKVTLPGNQLDAARKMSIDINQAVLRKKSL